MSDVTERPVVAVCSFCRKPNTEVATLVAGPGVFICNECVALCTQVIEGKPASVPQLAPWEQAATAEEVLANLLAHPELELVGLHCHLGSQLTRPQAYELAARRRRPVHRAGSAPARRGP